MAPQTTAYVPLQNVQTCHLCSCILEDVILDSSIRIRRFPGNSGWQVGRTAPEVTKLARICRLLSGVSIRRRTLDLLRFDEGWHSIHNM